MNKINKPVAITCGDFNGIGPEVIIKALNKLNLPADKILLIGAKELFQGLNKNYEIVNVPFDSGWLEAGTETKYSGEFSYNCLIKACELAKSGCISSIVTAPVSKNAMHLAGHNFSGQTEVFEKNLSNPTKDEKAEMLFVSGDFRVLLLTRHLALKDVCITKEILIEKIKRINRILKENFRIESPRIALCSLNPHAGEQGLLGREEIEEFAPAIEILRQNKINVSNPVPSDTLFVKASKAYLLNEKQPYDVYCACYHDQGLIPIKALAMDKTVNMTAGLCIVRTSPAHGTAYDIAGKDLADESSMVCAIVEALRFAEIEFKLSEPA